MVRWLDNLKILAFVLVSMIVSGLNAQTSWELHSDLNFWSDRCYSEVFSTYKLKKIKLVFEFGLGAGNFGRYEVKNTSNGISSVTPFSPYYLWTNNSEDPLLYLEQGYSLSNVGGKIFAGYGTYFSNSKFDLRILFSLGGYMVDDTHYHYYENKYTSQNQTYSETFKTRHFSISNSLKCYSTYLITKKIGVSFGVQVFFFIPIKNSLYRPESVLVPMMGVEYSSNVGFFYKIK